MSWPTVSSLKDDNTIIKNPEKQKNAEKCEQEDEWGMKRNMNQLLGKFEHSKPEYVSHGRASACSKYVMTKVPVKLIFGYEKVSRREQKTTNMEPVHLEVKEEAYLVIRKKFEVFASPGCEKIMLPLPLAEPPKKALFSISCLILRNTTVDGCLVTGQKCRLLGRAFCSGFLPQKRLFSSNTLEPYRPHLGALWRHQHVNVESIRIYMFVLHISFIESIWVVFRSSSRTTWNSNAYIQTRRGLERVHTILWNV